MADAFSKWRERKAVKQAARAEAAAAKAAAAPIEIYETLFLNRGWAMLILVIWTPIMLGLVILMALHEREIKDAVSWGTGLMTLSMLLLFVSLGLPFILATTRRRWSLFADRLEIRQRPLMPLLGIYRGARIPFADLAAARRGEMLNGSQLVEFETRGGSRFRLSPKMIGKGKQAHSDEEGFERFIEGIGAAIERAGVPRPPGAELKTFTSGIFGVVVLGIVTGLFAALCLFGIWVTLDGEPVGIQALGFGVPFFLLFGGLCLDRWRKWRARRYA